MRTPPASTAEHRSAAVTLGGGQQDAESLFCTETMPEIRNVESATRRNIEDKKEELRQLVGTRYRDLIDSIGGGVWYIEPNAKKLGLIAGNKSSPEESDFQSCLTAYFGPEVGQIRDAVDRRCQSVLEDLLNFFESGRAGLRLKDLAPYVQNKCYDSVSELLADVGKELECLCADMKKENNDSEAIPRAIII